MKPSRFFSITAVNLTSRPQLAVAATTALRVQVRNELLGQANPSTGARSGVDLTLMLDSVDGTYTSTGQLDTVDAQRAYILPYGSADVFVLAPGQKLYAYASGADSGQLSIAISEALPLSP